MALGSVESKAKKAKEDQDRLLKLINGENTEVNKEPVRSNGEDQKTEIKPALTEPEPTVGTQEVDTPIPEQTPKDEPVIEAEETKAVDPVIEPAKQDNEYEQKYKVLQGKYNAETKALRTEIDEFKSKFSLLESQILSQKDAELKEQKELEAKKVKDARSKKLESSRKRLKDAIGEDDEVVGAIDDYIDAIVSDRSNGNSSDQDNLDKGNSELHKRVDELSKKQDLTDADIFKASVKTQYPDLDNVLASPDFATFLSKVAPLTGYTHAQLLDYHDRNRDLGKVLDILNAFKSPTQSQEAKKTAPKVPVLPGKGSKSSINSSNIQMTPEEASKEFDIALKRARDGKMTQAEFNKIKENYQKILINNS